MILLEAAVCGAVKLYYIIQKLVYYFVSPIYINKGRLNNRNTAL